MVGTWRCEKWYYGNKYLSTFSGEKERIPKKHDETPKISNLRTARVVDC